MATTIGGGLEGSGPSLPLCAVSQHLFHGADGADALQLQGIGQRWAVRSWQRGPEFQGALATGSPDF